MRRSRVLFVLVPGLVGAACASTPKAEPAPTTESAASQEVTPAAKKEVRLVYPQTKMVNQVDDYHGTKVEDPYRWLEDTDAPETRAWIDAQNEITFGFLEKIGARKAIHARLEKLWSYERYSSPFRRGGRFFFYKNDGLQNQSVLYMQESLDAEPKVLLDPNTWSKEGTTALSGLAFSEDGTLVAYAKSEGGSDWQTWYVKRVEGEEELSDEVKWSKFSSASFTHDGQGFFYSRYPEPAGDALEEANFFHKVYYHRIGTPQTEDVLVFEEPDHKTRGFSAWVTDDGAYLMIHVWEGTDRRNRLYYKRLGKGGRFDPKTPVVRLLDDFDAGYDFIGNDGPVFFIRTDKDAPRGRIIAIDTRKPAKEHWQTIVPEGEDKLEGARMIGGGLLVFWLHDAHDRVTFHKLDGDLVRALELPVIGSVGGFDGKPWDTETFYTLSSFTYPATIFHLDLKTGKSTLFRKPNVDFEPDDYEVKQVRYRSKDGTSIPMFLVHKKGLALDGNNPTLLYGYGGFNISLTPAFDPSRIVWLEMGGVYAQPSLRGGGEFGQEWHEAGMLERKQNVFDDFAAAAEWLIENRYTRPEHLAISGRSNGGLLVGASITQRPELFGAAICGVGVLDMLRYHKFTIGHAWTSEYGSADVPEQFAFLIKYSPLHNVKAGARYPATLIVTADHDDRVVPAHSYKFAAALQKAQSKNAPVLIRIDTKAGHGAGKATKKLIEEKADEWAFLVESLSVDASGVKARMAAKSGAGDESDPAARAGRAPSAPSPPSPRGGRGWRGDSSRESGLRSRSRSRRRW